MLNAGFSIFQGTLRHALIAQGLGDLYSIVSFIVTPPSANDKLRFFGKIEAMNGGKKKKKTSSSELPNEKIDQKLKLILGDQGLLRDAGILRGELKKGPVGKMVEEAIKLDASFSASMREQIASNSPLDWASFSKHDFLAKTQIENNPTVRDAARVLAAKYDLRPLESWAQSLVSLILYGYCYPPSFDSLRALTPLLNRTNPENRNEVMDAIYKLREQNFGIETRKDDYTGKVSLFVELFENTSKNDIVGGWGAIKKIKDLALGKKNFYPLKNLDLANKIFALDDKFPKSKDKNDWESKDWEKQNKIFGETSDFETENKNMAKIKRVRHFYKKKRFGTKS